MQKDLFSILNSKKSRIIRLLNLAFILVVFVFITISNAQNENMIKNIQIDDRFELVQISDTTYSVDVPNDVECLDVSVIPTNQNADVEIKGWDNLEVGENTIEIKVKLDKMLKYYMINVNRLEE